MKKKLKCAIVHGDDWMGFYINGKIVHQGHSMAPFQVLEALGIDYEDIDPDMEWLEGLDCFPDKLSDVKLEK